MRKELLAAKIVEACNAYPDRHFVFARKSLKIVERVQRQVTEAGLTTHLYRDGSLYVLDCIKKGTQP